MDFQVIEKGMRFTLRDGSHTLGYGVVTELLKDADIEKLDLARKMEKKARMKEEREKENA